jgi:hypothetical protein
MTEFHLPPKYTQFKCSDKELVKIGFFFSIMEKRLPKVQTYKIRNLTDRNFTLYSFAV